MRGIYDHKCGDLLNDYITIDVVDEPGSGGANHKYNIFVQDGRAANLEFQEGPVHEVGPNGISQEALIAVCIDRLRCFQAGPFACRENALALTKLEEALMWLHARTRSRLAGFVEGKSIA